MAAWLRASIIFILFNLFHCSQERSFTVDKTNNCFLKDGKPFRYVSGSLHYFRVPQPYWRDRMLKMKAAGLNALQTYVEWSGHEPEPGHYNFQGDYDLFKFLQTAADVGLLVIFRPGPYICAERDFGGLPYWLMREKKDISLRAMDEVYIKYVDSWFGVLLPMVKPFLYANGGPIILVQIENEYGQFRQCDKTYMAHLRNLTSHHLGNDVIMFRTDTPSVGFYVCDSVDGVMVTADFGSGSNVENNFQQMRKIDPAGPLVVTEYYPGWMDHWGQAHANVETDAICKTLDDILAANASVNFYMFHGGTNFGFSNGANEPPYSSQPTSYDYTAPLSEAGDPTERYFKIREVIGKYMPLPPGPTPTPGPKMNIGPLHMDFIASIFDFLPPLMEPERYRMSYGQYPKSFEELSQAFGFVIYLTVIDFIPSSPEILQVPGLKDRGYVFVERTLAGVLSRSQEIYSVPVVVRKGQAILILVENQGRVNSGDTDLKGITSNVTLGSKVLSPWLMFSMPMNDSEAVHNFGAHAPSKPSVPGFYTVNFTLPKDAQPADTFLNPTGWNKGVAFLNEYNLGRYWPVMGPQVTLYCPGSMLRPYPSNNTLTLFELEMAPQNFSISFQNFPILNGSIPFDL